MPVVETQTELNFPSDCLTSGDKAEYAQCAQEKLRMLHNVFVKWRELGLNQEEYVLLPQKIKAMYPYKERITLEVQERFIKEEFEPRSDTIAEAILKQRAEFKKSTRWNIDPGEIPKFERF